MTDRELLERAAKAAGVPGEYLGGDIVHSEDGMLSFWNPLVSDGDALRLAVKRRQQIDMDASLPFVAAYDEGEATGVVKVTEPLGNDPAAATRRAIVRAAAAMAPAKESE